MEKKKVGKTILRIIGIIAGVIALIVAIVALIFGPTLTDGIKIYRTQSRLVKLSQKATYTETHLTKEQMLTDFDYMYEVLCESSLTREDTERIYGIDYDEIYKEYRTRVENCSDEFEFNAIITAFAGKLPGKHVSVSPFTNRVYAYSGTEFPLSVDLADEEVINTNYAFWQQNRERILSYDQKFAAVSYYDGQYMFLENSLGFDPIEGLKNGVLVSLDGESLDTAVKHIDFHLHWQYDKQYEHPFVKNIFFNDGVGTKYDAEIEYPDGHIEHRDLYISAEYNLAAYNRKKLYPDAFPSDMAEVQSKDTDDSGKCYNVISVPEKKLVYIHIASCEGGQEQQAYDEIRQAIKDANAEYVIIDNRDNGGGAYTFATEGVLKAVLKGKHEYISYSRTPYNPVTNVYFSHKSSCAKITDPLGGIKSEIFGTDRVEYLKDYARYAADFTVDGTAEKDYKIYVLNSVSTFSSGDVLTAVAKEADNVTIVGENTKGEGLCGHPLCYYLPESKMIFVSVSGVSERDPLNNVIGTEPDVYMGNGLKERMAQEELMKDYDVSDLKNNLDLRAKWDKVMKYVLDDIDNSSEK